MRKADEDWHWIVDEMGHDEDCPGCVIEQLWVRIAELEHQLATLAQPVAPMHSSGGIVTSASTTSNSPFDPHSVRVKWFGA